MRRLFAVIGLALVAPLLVPVAAGAQAEGCLNEYYLWVYEIEVNELEPHYQIGAKVPFEISVTEIAETNPADPTFPWIGPPPASQPAPDVPVGVQVMVGPKGQESYLWNLGTTDAQGLVNIPIKLKRYVQPGMAHAVVFARKEVFTDPNRCASIYKVGRELMPNAFEAVE